MDPRNPRSKSEGKQVRGYGSGASHALSRSYAHPHRPPGTADLVVAPEHAAPRIGSGRIAVLAIAGDDHTSSRRLRWRRWSACSSTGIETSASGSTCTTSRRRRWLARRRGAEVSRRRRPHHRLSRRGSRRARADRRGHARARRRRRSTLRRSRAAQAGTRTLKCQQRPDCRPLRSCRSSARSSSRAANVSGRRRARRS